MNPMPDTGLTLVTAPSNAPIQKQPWKSKTLWTSFFVTAFALYPPTAELSSHYPGAVLIFVSIVFFFLRLITHGKISLQE